MPEPRPPFRRATRTSTGRGTPYQYHLREIKVANMQEKLKRVSSVPSNKHLFEKTRSQYEEKPIEEMWLNMQLMNSREETNEKGIAKVWLILDSFPHIYRLIGLSLICHNLCN